MGDSDNQLLPDTSLVPAQPADASAAIIKIAVMAVGGQGGGVLTSWIADLATRAGYAVQMTSVAGVAQRTGATIYYVEMAPPSAKQPVFALNPSPGDVDILIAAEMMEAGRAILRGFVTEDKTTLIASTHRILAISEKQVPGDGRAEAAVVADRFTASALKSVCFDMQAIADNAGTMISSSLFGALARSGALPFEQTLYEQVIIASGRGVDQSLAAFHAAIAHEMDPQLQHSPTRSSLAGIAEPTGPAEQLKRWQELHARVLGFPSAVHSMAMAGLTGTVDYQDLDYGSEYLDHLSTFVKLDKPEHHFALSIAAAKYVANAMCYDDILRVADLKTRSSRDARIKQEQQVRNDQIVHVTEYFHPRAEEFCATLPSSIGAWIEVRPKVFSVTQKLVNKGRRIRTDGMIGFAMLWIVAGLRPYRRKLLRHRYETQHLKLLLSHTHEALNANYELAIEVLQCQRLIKGYSDTHSRGQSKFKRVSESAIASMNQANAASWVKQLRETALQDEHGDELDQLLASCCPR